MFIDESEIKVVAGKGGDGIVSWRREKYIPKGGPRGGNGGNGGSVFLETDTNLNTLSNFRNKRIFKAQSGQRGGTQNMNGETGEDLILKVPVGTIIKEINSGKIIADLDEENQKLLIAKGGRGGYGNSHFVSSTRQAPGFAEYGDIGEEKELKLELKLVADIGIIGIPSAGKSSLINVLTNVKAKIGEYPFTTLIPNLGVMEYKDKSLILEDVPGLIPGASKGKGLGIEFLKHIERTGVLLHLLDLYRLDKIFEDYKNIRGELEFFSKSLAKKQEIIIFSKADLLDDEMIKFIEEEFKKKYPDKKYFAVSSANSKGIDELKDYLIKNISPKRTGVKKDERDDKKMKIYDLKNNKDPNSYKLKYNKELEFEIKGERIEQIVRMTNFDNPEAVSRIYDVLDKVGAIKKIEKELRTKEIDDSFYYEGGEVDNTPKLIIGNKILNLDKLKYNI